MKNKTKQKEETNTSTMRYVGVTLTHDMCVKDLSNEKNETKWTRQKKGGQQQQKKKNTEETTSVAY